MHWCIPVAESGTTQTRPREQNNPSPLPMLNWTLFLKDKRLNHVSRIPAALCQAALTLCKEKQTLKGQKKSCGWVRRLIHCFLDSWRLKAETECPTNNLH